MTAEEFILADKPGEIVLIPREVKLEQWGEGEWLDEPDLVIWDYKGMRCIAQRNMVWEGPNNENLSIGNINGYVRIPAGHVWFEKDYTKIDADVHGGLTFGEMVKDGEFWIGFDTAHSFDCVPSLEKFMRNSEENKRIENLDSELRKAFGNPLGGIDIFKRTYRNLAYVKAECESLVDQAITASE